MCVSFLSIELKIISQFRLRKLVGFKDLEMFLGGDSIGYVASEMFSSNVYISDKNNKYNWNLTDFRVILGNNSFITIQSADGRIIDQFTAKYTRFWQFLEFFWDSDDNNLFAVENIFGDSYLFETKNYNWSKIGPLRHYHFYFLIEQRGVFYVTKEKQIYLCRIGGVEILALNKKY